MPSTHLQKLESLLTELKKRDIYTIARVVAFKDFSLSLRLLVSIKCLAVFSSLTSYVLNKNHQQSLVPTAGLEPASLLGDRF